MQSEGMGIMYHQSHGWTAVMLLIFLKAWKDTLVVVLHVIVRAEWNLKKILFNAIKNDI